MNDYCSSSIVPLSVLSPSQYSLQQLCKVGQWNHANIAVRGWGCLDQGCLHGKSEFQTRPVLVYRSVAQLIILCCSVIKQMVLKKLAKTLFTETGLFALPSFKRKVLALFHWGWWRLGREFGTDSCRSPFPLDLSLSPYTTFSSWRCPPHFSGVIPLCHVVWECLTLSRFFFWGGGVLRKLQ